jgi:hypothetical protein
MLASVFNYKASACSLPIPPAFSVDHSAVWQTQQKLSRLIFDVDEIIRKQTDFLVDLATLEAVDGYGCLRHVENIDMDLT